MARFWKFNAFVGAVATVLLLVAYFTGNHSEFYNHSENFYQISWVNTEYSKYYLVAAAACYGWQLLMTVMGLLVGFFAGPSYR